MITHDEEGIADARVIRGIANRHLPGSGLVQLTRPARGVSTPVYRIHRDGITRYLRLAESAKANLAPEVLALDQLRDRGVRVPEVVHFEPFNQDLGRSLMITSEIPGRSLADHHAGIDLGAVLNAAGRDLARIASVPVEGFGFVRRDLPDQHGLVAANPTVQAFALDALETHLAALTSLLTWAEVQAVRRVVERYEIFLDADEAVLAHGDLDATHIYHQDGVYSGVIDFGEIRGADHFYDLGHVALHDGEIIPVPMLPLVLAGYDEVSPLPLDSEQRIPFWSLLIGVRALARSVSRPQALYETHLVKAVRASLATLAM
jgi:Ser/Thr protein kinase RdoA (MazF antagonist)